MDMNDRLSPESDKNGEATSSSPAISLPNLPFGIGPYGKILNYGSLSIYISLIIVF